LIREFKLNFAPFISLIISLSVGIFSLIPDHLHASEENPEAIVVPVSSLGEVSEVRKQILQNTLEDELKSHFRLTSQERFEEVQEKVFEELEYDECTEEQCIVMIQEMLQVENVFHLQVIGEGDDTQLSLSWRTLDEKKKETDVCMGCGTFQLNDKVDGLVEKLVGVKKEVVVKEEPPKKVETKKSVSAPRIKRQQTKAKAEEQQFADEEKRLEEERKLLEAEKKRFAETQRKVEEEHKRQQELALRNSKQESETPLITSDECKVVCNNLGAYYPFNKNANDLSGNGYHLIVKGASLTHDRFGRINNAYNFGGKAEHLIFQGSMIYFFKKSTTFSIIFTIENFNKQEMSIIGDQEGAIGLGTFYDTRSNKYALNFSLRKNKNNWDASYVQYHGLKSGVPYHVVGIIDERTKRIELYINGKLIESKYWFERVDFGKKLVVGGWYHGIGKNNFMGKIDELRLYDTALNTEQIHILFKEVFEMHQAKVHDEAVLKR